MNEFSPRSKAELSTCHPELRRLFNEVLKLIDITVITGMRGEAAQNLAVLAGTSKLKYPLGKHNKTPSLAVDVAPYPLDWENRARFYYLAGIVKATAKQLNIKIRWGGDWDNDQTFNTRREKMLSDLPHFELIDTDTQVIA